MPTPYTRITTSGVNSLASTTLGNLKPYQIRQMKEWLDGIAWGKANSTAGQGSDSNVGNQPTIAQIVTLVTPNNA